MLSGKIRDAGINGQQIKVCKGSFGIFLGLLFIGVSISVFRKCTIFRIVSWASRGNASISSYNCCWRFITTSTIVRLADIFNTLEPHPNDLDESPSFQIMRSPGSEFSLTNRVKSLSFPTLGNIFLQLSLLCCLCLG